MSRWGKNNSEKDQKRKQQKINRSLSFWIFGLWPSVLSGWCTARVRPVYLGELSRGRLNVWRGSYGDKPTLFLWIMCQYWLNGGGAASVFVRYDLSYTVAWWHRLKLHTLYSRKAYFSSVLIFVSFGKVQKINQYEDFYLRDITQINTCSIMFQLKTRCFRISLWCFFFMKWQHAVHRGRFCLSLYQ